MCQRYTLQYKQFFHCNSFIIFVFQKLIVFFLIQGIHQDEQLELC